MGLAAPAAAQPAPQLSTADRALLQMVVQAVDAASVLPDSTDATIRTHVLRASDGSHYVAFSIAPGVPLPAHPLLLYVRLATATPAAAERSAVREWLAGNASAPPPIFSRFGIAIGEMPAMGATANLSQRPFAIQGSTDLQVMALERQRERDRQAALAAKRRAELEGTLRAASELLPFEDFDGAARATTVNGTHRLERALTAGPGDYALLVGWADPAAPDPATSIQVVKTGLRLPAATTDTLSVSSVIIADAVRVRSAPYGPAEQAAHPYAIGLTEIVPAPDGRFTADERLSVAFQIINARPSDAGKPDLEAAVQIVRLVADREEPVAALTPQYYSAATLPDNFDLRVGHPVLAAISAPLASLRHGAYRLKIAVTDRLAGRSATADADFTVAATAASLLKDAPPPASPFRHETVIGSEVLPYVIRALQPTAPSPALQRALASAAAGRFIDLVDEPVTESEEGVRAALRGLALLSLGDGSAAVHFQRALLLGAPLAPARLLSGAARALQGRDPDAISAWQEALAAGAPRPLVAPFLLEAHLRRADYPRAAALVADTASPPAIGAWTRGVAALRIAQQQERDAVRVLDAHLAEQPDDIDAQWLRLHALFALFAGGDAASRERVVAEARAYADRLGPRAALARDWLAAAQQER